MIKITPYILIVLSTILFTIFLVDSEKHIIELEQQLHLQELHCDSTDKYIDSLLLEIDTLIHETEVWDQHITYNNTHLLSAIIHVESSGRDSAYHKGEDAVGCLQIRRCMVDDVNRILLRQKSDVHFTYDDRWMRSKSIKMFEVYCKHYGLTTAEEIARCWNGGPRGINNPATAGYWNKVEKKIEEEYALR